MTELLRNVRRGRNSSASGARFKPHAFTLAVASAFAMPLPVLAQTQALPGGANVVNGAASFQQSGKNLTVTNTPGAVINWQSFSIGAGNSVQFVQQNSSSAVFNRVTGSEPSNILGSMSSNGRIFLINPNGITIGAGARIDAAAFVASTLGISNSDLLAGKFKFEGGAGSGNVVNRGTIVTQDGGYVYFIGKDVKNDGVIHTPNGQILLAAGHSVEIINPHSPDMAVEISANNNQAVNLGQLVAAGGTVGMYGGNVHQKGLVSATTAEVNAQGKIVFVAKKNVELAAGSLTEANGPNGGSVTIQAQTGTATVAGTVEAKGTSAAAPVANLPTYTSDIAPQNTITVAAGPNGNGQQAGGSAPVFVSAAPLPVASKPAVSTEPAAAPAPTLKGGTIEITGETVNLTGNASVNASGEQGGGTILIGGDLHGANAAVQNALHTYVASGVVLNADALLSGNGGKVVVWAEDDTHFVGSISALGGLLGGNGGVGETSGKGTLYFRPTYVSLAARRSGYDGGTLLLDPSDITITKVAPNGPDNSTGGAIPTDGATPYDPAGVSTADIDGIVAILNNGTSVTIQTSSGSGGTGNITLAAGQTISKTAGGNATLTLLADKAILLDGGSSITSSAGQLGVNLTAGTTITVNGSITTNGGNVVMKSPGNVVLGANITIGAGSLNVSATGTGTITQSAGNVTVSGTTTLSTNGTDITLNSGGNNFGTVVVSSGLDVTLVDTDAIILGASTISGTLSVTAGSDITQSGVLSVTGAATFDAGTNAVNLGNTSNNFSTVSVTNGGDVTLADGGNLDLGALTLNGNLVVTANGNITQSGAIAAHGTNKTASFDAGAITANHDITLSNVSNDFNAVSVAHNSSATVVDTNALTLGTSTSAGAINVTAGAITQTTGSITAGGALNLTGSSLTSSGGLAGSSIGIQVSGASTASGVINTAGALTKSGAGMLTVSNSGNTIGSTTVSAGTLQVSSAGALGANASVVTIASTGTLDIIGGISLGNAVALNGGKVSSSSGTNTASGAITLGAASTVDVGSGSNLTLSGVIDDGGSNFNLVKANTGTLVLSNTNSYGGGTNVTAGVLQLSNAGAAGVGTVSVGGSATLDLINGVNFARTITLNGGTLMSSSGTNIDSGAVILNGNSTINVASGAQLSVVGGVSGIGFNLNKTGAGALVLGNVNTYTGATNVNAGTLKVGNADALAASSGATVASGATLDLNGMAVNANATLNGGTLTSSNGDAALVGTIALGAATTSNISAVGGSTLSLNGAISGAGNVNVTGTGAVAYGATNGYTGATTIASGATLQTATAGISTSSAIHDGGILTINEGASGTLAQTIDGAGTLNKTGTGVLIVTGNNTTFTGTTNVNQGTLQLGNGGAGGALGGAIADNATLSFNRSGAYTAGNTLTGAGAINVTGGGTLTLSAGNGGYTGVITVAGAGTDLVVGNANALGGGAGGTTVHAGAKLDLGGFSVVSEAITLAGGTLANGIGSGSLGLASTVAMTADSTIDVGGTQLSVSGLVSGGFALTKTGSGTLVLGNAGNGYSGGTNLTGGIISVAADGDLGTGGLTFNGGTLQTTAALNSAKAITMTSAGAIDTGTFTDAFSGAVSGSGTLTKLGSAGTLTLSGNNSGYSGAINLNAGTLQAGSGSAFGTGLV
ncbi:MAG TPA: autotransporter-associated beta strand repeat-containing protein, partial [Burkholderiales bacterium]